MNNSQNFFKNKSITLNNNNIKHNNSINKTSNNQTLLYDEEIVNFNLSSKEEDNDCNSLAICPMININEENKTLFINNNNKAYDKIYMLSDKQKKSNYQKTLNNIIILLVRYINLIKYLINEYSLLPLFKINNIIKKNMSFEKLNAILLSTFILMLLLKFFYIIIYYNFNNSFYVNNYVHNINNNSFDFKIDEYLSKLQFEKNSNFIDNYINYNRLLKENKQFLFNPKYFINKKLFSNIMYNYYVGYLSSTSLASKSKENAFDSVNNNYYTSYSVNDVNKLDNKKVKEYYNISSQNYLEYVKLNYNNTNKNSETNNNKDINNFIYNNNLSNFVNISEYNSFNTVKNNSNTHATFVFMPYFKEDSKDILIDFVLSIKEYGKYWMYVSANNDSKNKGRIVIDNYEKKENGIHKFNLKIKPINNYDVFYALTNQNYMETFEEKIGVYINFEIEYIESFNSTVTNYTDSSKSVNSNNYYTSENKEIDYLFHKISKVEVKVFFKDDKTLILNLVPSKYTYNINNHRYNGVHIVIKQNNFLLVLMLINLFLFIFNRALVYDFQIFPDKSLKVRYNIIIKNIK